MKNCILILVISIVLFVFMWSKWSIFPKPIVRFEAALKGRNFPFEVQFSNNMKQNSAVCFVVSPRPRSKDGMQLVWQEIKMTVFLSDGKRRIWSEDFDYSGSVNDVYWISQADELGPSIAFYLGGFPYGDGEGEHIVTIAVKRAITRDGFVVEKIVVVEDP